jgi:hypothetical protein
MERTLAKRPLARNLYETLRGKVDPAVLEAIVGLAEYQNVQRQQILDLANLLNSVIDQMNDLAGVMGVMRGKIDKYKEHLPKGIDTEHEVQN